MSNKKLCINCKGFHGVQLGSTCKLNLSGFTQNIYSSMHLRHAAVCSLRKLTPLHTHTRFRNTASKIKNTHKQFLTHKRIYMCNTCGRLFSFRGIPARLTAQPIWVYIYLPYLLCYAQHSINKIFMRMYSFLLSILIELN